MLQTVSKSQFKPQALEFLRKVEESNTPLIITHAGKPVIKVIPYSEPQKKTLKSLKGTVLTYTEPIETVGEDDWETAK